MLVDADRAPLVGTWLKLDTLETVEIAASVGLDFVIVDCEHALISTSTLRSMLAVASREALRVYVRVARADSPLAALAMDQGADGIVVPNVHTEADAISAVSHMRFAPRGARGLSNSGRAGQWGAIGVDQYMNGQDQRVRLLMQIESPQAVENAVAIAAVPGVDGLLVGPADLQASVRSSPTSPIMEELLGRLESDCARLGILLATAASGDVVGARELVRRGYQMVAMSSDVGLLRSAMAALRTASG